MQGLDRLEVAYYARSGGTPSRRLLGAQVLDRAHFSSAGGPFRYGDLLIADPSDQGGPEPATSGAVIWPEDLGDPDVYSTYAGTSDGNRRINLTIIPDGYTYGEKQKMKLHAAALVAFLRAKTPYKEHDPFINYTLVYEYSREAGTDPCDCGVSGLAQSRGNERDHGSTECNGDCDDASPSTFRGAPEVNDGEDNECPGDAGYDLLDEISGGLSFSISPGIAIGCRSILGIR